MWATLPGAAPAAGAPWLTLSMGRPFVEARLGDQRLRLRVDLDQRDVVELNPAAAARLPVTFGAGYDVDVGRVRLAGRQASVKLAIDGMTVPVVLAEHGRDCCADADGAIGVDLLPHEGVRFVGGTTRLTARRTLTLTASEERGLSARQAIGGEAVALGFSLSAPTSMATIAAGAVLAKVQGGRLRRPQTMLAAAFGVPRRTRLLALDRPVLLAGFRFADVPVRLGDFGGGRSIPQDASVELSDLVVAARRSPQEAWPLVLIGRDRLDRCAAISFEKATRQLTLDCAFDEPAADAATPANQAELRQAVRVLDRVAALVRRRYWDRTAAARWADTEEAWRPRLLAAAGDRRLFYGLLNAWLDTLGDSHVYAIDPARLRLEKARARSGEATGYGFTALPDDAGRWQVLRVAPDSPAARQGVSIGWTLVSIDGSPVDVADDPPPGARATLAFIDDAGEPRRLQLEAVATPEAPVWQSRRLPRDVLLVTLSSFDPGAERWLDRQLVPLPRAVILDLRENGGGEAGAIAGVAGRFFAERRVLVCETGRRTREETVRATGSYLGPLAVLVGRRSASGAEALAALVAESGRGLTVGERTAGRLTSAAHYRLPDGGELSLAEADIRTGAGTRIEGVGFTPAVMVTPPLADLRAGRDPVLETAVARLR